MPTLSAHSALKPRLEGSDREFLTRIDSALKLSLYVPLEKSWVKTPKLRILLADLRKEAAAQLGIRGALQGGIEAVLSPLDALIGDPGMPLPGEGLALFSDGEAALAFSLGHSPAPFAQIDTCFRLEDILPRFQSMDRYYLVSLDQHSIRLWDCDSVSMREIPLEGMETDIRDHIQDADYQSLFHSVSAGRAGRPVSSYSGIDPVDAKERKIEIDAFFRRIDSGLRARMPDPALPLILAGAGFLLPRFRKASSHAEILDGEIHGTLSAHGGQNGLHQRANALMRDRALTRMEADWEVFLESRAQARSCAGYSDVLPCASRGQVTHLFQAYRGIQWGEFDPGSGRAETFPAFRNGAVDLANLACVLALRGHAVVHSVPEAGMPEWTAIAALTGPKP